MVEARIACLAPDENTVCGQFIVSSDHVPSVPGRTLIEACHAVSPVGVGQSGVPHRSQILSLQLTSKLAGQLQVFIWFAPVTIGESPAFTINNGEDLLLGLWWPGC
jgi:hypothetical protein